MPFAEFCDLVVSDRKRSLLRGSQMDVPDDRQVVKIALLRREIPCMSGEDLVVLVDVNRIGESEMFEIFLQDSDLPIRMLLGIPRIRL